VTGSVNITEGDEDALHDAVGNVQPVSVAFQVHRRPLLRDTYLVMLLVLSCCCACTTTATTARLVQLVLLRCHEFEIVCTTRHRLFTTLQVVNDFMHYHSGVYQSTDCKNGPQDVNHAVWPPVSVPM
jgi:hypothetical protein